MLVIGLGIAILLVVAAMIGMGIRNAYNKDATPALSTSVVKPGEIPELNLDLAPGASITESRMEGTHLVVRITGPQGDEVLVIDPVRQKVLSRIRFNKKAP